MTFLKIKFYLKIPLFLLALFCIENEFINSRMGAVKWRAWWVHTSDRWARDEIFREQTCARQQNRRRMPAQLFCRFGLSQIPHRPSQPHSRHRRPSGPLSAAPPAVQSVASLQAVPAASRRTSSWLYRKYATLTPSRCIQAHIFSSSRTVASGLWLSSSWIWTSKVMQLFSAVC